MPVRSKRVDGTAPRTWAEGSLRFGLKGAIKITVTAISNSRSASGQSQSQTANCSGHKCQGEGMRAVNV